MTATLVDDFGRRIGARMQAEHRTLAMRWLEHLDDLLPVATNDVFPTDALLDHIPSMIAEIAGSLADTAAEDLAANTFVLDKARELGELRYEQRASVHQLLREYRVLSRILVAFVEDETRDLGLVAPREVIGVLSRVWLAVEALQQTSVETFIAKYTTRMDEQTRRLENFNRLVSHELRQPIGALQFAFKLVDSSGDLTARAGYREVIERNLTRLVRMTDQLATMSRLKPSSDTAQTQQVPLAMVVSDVARQLRDMAERRNVDIRMPADFPVLEMDVAAVELILVNLVANAIKYSDPDKPVRFVDVRSESTPDDCTLVVADNGLGIAAQHLPRIFERAYRAHADRDGQLGVEGFGLGLALVYDCVTERGGQIAVDSHVGQGTTFRVTLPCLQPAS